MVAVREHDQPRGGQVGVYFARTAKRALDIVPPAQHQAAHSDAGQMRNEVEAREIDLGKMGETPRRRLFVDISGKVGFIAFGSVKRETRNLPRMARTLFRGEYLLQLQTAQLLHALELRMLRMIDTVRLRNVFIGRGCPGNDQGCQ